MLFRSRPYRPYIVRYDTFLPVTICLVFIFGVTAVYLINYYRSVTKIVFIVAVVAIMVYFTKEDRINWDGNKCDREALTYLANSPDKVVFLDYWCSPMDWSKITEPQQSEMNCQLLKYWKVLKEDKLYYQRPN